MSPFYTSKILKKLSISSSYILMQHQSKTISKQITSRKNLSEIPANGRKTG